MERKLDTTSAETVADASLPPPPRPVAMQSSGVASRVVSSSTSIPDEGRFVPGTMLNGRYRIIGLLGQGGMGEVYRATDLTLGQSVALKFLPETAAGNVRLLERFHAEVRIARQVSHPNVCRVYDIGEAEGLPFLSMEYIDGEDLASLLQRIGRLPSDKALETARKVCAGLNAAHDKGVIHRDLKPHNIMLNKRGEVVIMDFGLAAVANSLTGVEARNGTPAYMSPEQLKGSEVTARSDIYALGLVLFELFTGKRPFEAKTLQSLIDQQEALQFTSMVSITADVDPTVEKVIRRCLDPDPAKRPATPLGVAAALPGGDPLAAALAAGETPSPEMVAAAGNTEGLARKWASLCLAIVAISLLTVPLVRDRTAATAHSTLRFPPDVLAQKAREHSAALGYTAVPKDSIIRLYYEQDLLKHLNAQKTEKKWREWLEAEAPISAWYRETPAWLIASPGGDVTMENPVLKQAGMVNIRINGHGKLRWFEASPNKEPAAVPVTAEKVFAAMGFDLTKFTEGAPTTIPQVASDQMRAWKGAHPGLPNTNITVEIGWFRGQVTSVSVAWPWTPADGNVAANTSSVTTAERVRQIFYLVCAVLGVFAVILHARTNWKRGRGDRKGAVRVAIAQFVLALVVWAGQTHGAPPNLITGAFSGFGNWLALSAAMWLLYLALEPAVRARWPHALVTWSRLLEGRFSDAQVCAHVLIGAAAGAGFWAIAAGSDMWRIAHTGVEGGGRLASTLGVRFWIATVVSNISSAMMIGFLVFFLIFGLKMLLRKDLLAAIVAALFFSLGNSGTVFSHPYWQVDLAITFLLFCVLIFILLRLGLVAMMVAVFFLNLIGNATVTSDVTAWYVPAGIAMLALLMAISIYAFNKSLGNRMFMGGEEPAV